MSKKSSLPIDVARWLMLAVALLLPPSVYAAKKDDLYKQAQAAVNAGRVGEAARLFCEVAKEDAGYKDAKTNCTIYSQEAERENKRSEERFQEGLKAFQDKRWDDAEQKFKNVRSGPRLEEARQYLNSRIPNAKAAEVKAAEGAAVEKVMAQRFDQGVQAYQRNDFGGAKSALGGVSGSKEGEAKNYLNKIREYEQAMNEGDRLAAAQNYRGAMGSYSEAATIKGDGPGDPRSKASQMEKAMAAAAATPTTTTTTTPDPTPTPVKPPPTTTTRPVEAAIKEPTRPQVDVARLLREAQAAKDKGDISSARGKYLAILSAEPNNRQVQAALASLPKETGTQAPKAATSEADVLLATAIGEFYKGSYDDAEFHLRLYIENNGGKSALGNFYLGVSRLTRYFLRGAKPDDRKLMDDGLEAFKLAKKTASFRAPGERYLSPKILKMYQDATP